MQWLHRYLVNDVVVCVCVTRLHTCWHVNMRRNPVYFAHVLICSTCFSIPPDLHHMITYLPILQQQCLIEGGVSGTVVSLILLLQMHFLRNMQILAYTWLCGCWFRFVYMYVYANTGAYICTLSNDKNKVTQLKFKTKILFPTFCNKDQFCTFKDMHLEPGISLKPDIHVIIPWRTFFTKMFTHSHHPSVISNHEDSNNPQFSHSITHVQPPWHNYHGAYMYVSPLNVDHLTYASHHTASYCRQIISVHRLIN